MKCSAFGWGLGLGLAVGAAAGIAVAAKQRAMHTCVGRTMQNMGAAMDDLLRSVR